MSQATLQTRARTKKALADKSTNTEVIESPTKIAEKMPKKRAKKSSENREGIVSTGKKKIKNAMKRGHKTLTALNNSADSTDSPKPKASKKAKAKEAAKEIAEETATITVKEAKNETLNKESAKETGAIPKTKTNDPSTSSNNNNNNNSMHDLSLEIVQKFKRICELQLEMGNGMCFLLDKPELIKSELEPEMNEGIECLREFFTKSTIKDTVQLPTDCDTASTSQIFQHLISAIYKLETVQLDQLIDLYHLAIMMQTYSQLDTHCMGQRFELLDAVSLLAHQLTPEYIEFIGISLCERFVFGTGKKRMERFADMHNALAMLIIKSDVDRQIAMSILLATFAKISGIAVPNRETDIIRQTFEMVKLVDWLQLVVSGHGPDVFVLVRCFSLIINSHHNRSAHPKWDMELGSEIHTFFMAVLRTIRLSKNYNFFTMKMERFIAFCIVRGATPRGHSTELL